MGKHSQPHPPINLLPIRAAVEGWQHRPSPTTASPAVEFADWAADTLRDLCDEVVRLRAELADAAVVTE